MSFTDQKPCVVTKEDLQRNWSGGNKDERFRCYICGHKFVLGDVWRFVFVGEKYINFLTCEKCDGPDVKERWIKINEEYEASKIRFWWAYRD